MASHTKVAVIGGGVLGISTAAGLAAQGAQVTLITRDRLGEGASGRSLSWLNSFWTRNPAYHHLRLLGIDRYRTLAARERPDFLRFDGGLTWAAAGDDGHREAFEHLQSVGYDARWLAPEEIAGWTPGVDPASVPADGAVFNPGEGWVDLPSLIALLAQRFRAAGGEILENRGDASVEVRGDRVRAVHTDAGRPLEVDAVVLATGPSVPAAAAAAGVNIPDGTTPALLVRTAPIDHPLTAVLNTPRVAVRPTPSGSFVLDSAWSEAELELGPDGTYQPGADTVERLLGAASAVLDGNPALVVESTGIGLKPIPGDGEPVLGALPGVDGYHVAFTHSGATLGLIIGELLAAEVVTGKRSPLLDAFRPERFA
ncbi:Glycine/D-amino acid oxidase [Nakamurella panacisegetis]|uniref:Glycine/D-amino acid oxidase n=1 Tax=Nakamurella panacisegetis TaxID=1090615 RepID=A0A1H0HDJ9_9ACTN|nr:FAD-binding oxidoreductase [Nakamurella panacisegetis]SDO17218.1 Glycine/D-amino acid oxidase [Nakamurella panacisegetis]